MTRAQLSGIVSALVTMTGLACLFIGEVSAPGCIAALCYGIGGFFYSEARWRSARDRRVDNLVREVALDHE